VRHGDWKLVQNSPFELLQLYNLKDDPEEKIPLGKRHKEYRRLFAALQNHVNESGTVPWQRGK